LNGNFREWISLDSRWIESRGWVFYLIAGLIPVVFRYRGILVRLMGNVQSTSRAIDHKIDELNIVSKR